MLQKYMQDYYAKKEKEYCTHKKSFGVFLDYKIKVRHKKLLAQLIKLMK